MLKWLKKLFRGKEKEAPQEEPREEIVEPAARPAPQRIARDDSPTVQIPRPQGEPRPRNTETTVDLFEREEEAPQPAQRAGIRTAMATHIGTREYQQDAVYVCDSVDDPEGYAFAVLCDGMGGMEDGGKASADVVEYMVNRLATLPPDASVPDFFEDALREANEHVLTQCGGAGKASGTTLVAVVLREGGLYWAAVGDSRIYIVRRGDMVQVTRDHNYAMQLQEQVEAGKMSQSDADASPLREALVSYIGAPVLEIVDISRGAFPLQPGDIALLCSDGLTKSLPDKRILQLLAANMGDLGEAARLLPLAAFDEGSGNQDNTSVILMQYKG